MKYNLALMLVAVSMVAMSGSKARAEESPSAGTREEVAVQALLAPTVGYEEKNNVQVVLYGFLPNSCYTLGEYTVERLGEGHSIMVRQYAMHDTTGICAEESSLPLHMRMMVPFTSEVSVGRLTAGNYSFLYKAGDGQRSRSLSVSTNISPNVDTLPYAAVSATQASDVINGKDHVYATISGVLNSSCTRLDENIKILKQDDVFVILPTIRVKQRVDCTLMLRPFSREVDLGTAAPGLYLIHTRSMNGKSVNKVVTVTR